MLEVFIYFFFLKQNPKKLLATLPAAASVLPMGAKQLCPLQSKKK